MEMSIDRMDLTGIGARGVPGHGDAGSGTWCDPAYALKDPVWVMADHDRLSQVLYNLLGQRLQLRAGRRFHRRCAPST